MTKIMYCTSCGDMCSLDRYKRPTYCECKQFVAWWHDPYAGEVRYCAAFPRCAWFIGLNNRFLAYCNSHEHVTTGEWIEAHDEATNAPGYVFDKTVRGCWAAPFRPETDLISGVRVANIEEIEDKLVSYPDDLRLQVFLERMKQ